MDEATARRVRAVHAFDTTSGADDALWTAEDRAWASRVARETIAADAPVEDFIAARAQAALRRLEPRDALLARWLHRPASRPGMLALLLLASVAVGIAAHSIGDDQRINLLAPPVWAVLAWNLVVYLAVAWHALAGGRGSAAPLAGWRRVLARWLTGSQRPARESRRGGRAAAWAAFAAAWSRDSAPLATARLAGALHLAAAALAIGLVAGLYLRGLVLDYRAGWQSTFLEPSTVAAVLDTLLAPASVLSGIALPDAAGIAALRVQPGELAKAPAAPWIHLYAITLGLFVVLPRLLLALASGWRAARLARRFPLQLDAGYVQALRRQQGGDVPQHVRLLPHGQAPSGAAVLALRAALAPVLGDKVQVELLPAVDFGNEDEANLDRLVAGGGWAALLFDLTATPESEHHGTLIERLVSKIAGQDGPARPMPIVLLDESAFVRRFGADSPRRKERREAWRQMCERFSLRPLFAELESAQAGNAERAVARWFELEAAPAASR